MCGITGFYDQKMRGSKELIATMTKTLNHRGPDDSGIHFHQHDQYQLGLGHSRLSIIDLSKDGHQPMFSGCGNYCIVFNGEIYNYRALKKEILSEEVFHSNSDTEVLLELYKKKGTGFITFLRGMFAFVIIDLKNQKLIAGRDHIGVKPFYYYFNDGLFLFGSELKSIHAHPSFKPVISNEALADYFSIGYIPAKKSIYQNTHKLEKGNFLELDLIKGAISIQAYWDINAFYRLPKLSSNQYEIEEQLLAHFIEAFKYRLVSDVPIGVFLSGGYDSSLLTAILTKELNQSLTTFTIGFKDKELDESSAARRISSHFETNHHEYFCTEEDALNLVEKLPSTYDEPFSDPSAIPTMLVSKWASSHVKVALSADGGDENFVGYNRYQSYVDRISKFHRFTGNSLPPGVSNFIGGFLPSSKKWVAEVLAGEFSAYLKKATCHVSDRLLNKILIGKFERNQNRHFETTEMFDQLVLWDIDQYLPDNVLVKVDRASMAFGLESREPLLDFKVMEFVAQIPFDMKYQNRVLKTPIKNIVHRYIDKNIMDHPKKGFSPPLEKWLKSIFAEEFADLTTPDFLKNQGVFNTKQLLSTIESTTPNYLKYRLIWSLFVFQKWYSTWIKKS